MRRWIIAAAVLLVLIIVAWFGSALWFGAKEADDLQAYATNMESVGTRMEQVGQTLESLAQTNPFSWSEDEQAQWQAIRSTVTQTQEDVEEIEAPEFLAEAHSHAVGAVKTYGDALGDLDAIIKGGAANAKEADLEDIIRRIDGANAQIGDYLTQVEAALRERYGDDAETSSALP
jgi:hypothetical protein